MENTLLQRVFALASGPINFTKLDPVASVIRQLKHADNGAAAAGSIATILGKLSPEAQEQVVAAVEALAK